MRCFLINHEWHCQFTEEYTYTFITPVSTADIWKILLREYSERKRQTHHHESLESIQVFDLNYRSEEAIKHWKMPLLASFLSLSLALASFLQGSSEVRRLRYID